MRFLLLIGLTSVLFAEPKKKVLILCSHGGYSHEAAAKTITHLLKEDYVCKTIFPITDYCPLGLKNSENIYNFLFARGWNRTLEFLSGASQLLFKVRSKSFERYFSGQIEREKPDLVISVAPFFNGPAITACHKSAIPFLLASIDDDMWIWLANFRKPKGVKFRFAVPRLRPQVVASIEAAGVDRSEIVEMGQLLRPEFQCRLPDKETLRKKHGIPVDKRVILILMGGAGSDVCVAYAKKVAALDLNAHLIVCTGRYESLAEEIDQLKVHKSNTIQAMRFTDSMAELMGLSDLMILKPGPSAVFEAVAVARAPLLLDTTLRPIVWERSNVDYVTSRGIGAKVRRIKYLPRLLKQYLFDTKERKAALYALESTAPNRSSSVIKELVYELCPPERPLVKDSLEVDVLKAAAK